MHRKKDYKGKESVVSVVPVCLFSDASTDLFCNTKDGRKSKSNGLIIFVGGSVHVCSRIERALVDLPVLAPVGCSHCCP